jgi:pimeloyl-ACP methyl ester carboxylesterase
MLKEIIIAGIAVAVSGCAGNNPLMPITSAEARVKLEEIQHRPMALPRPLVIVSGFGDLGIPAKALTGRFRSVFDDRRILAVSFVGCRTFDACADRLITAVQAKFPSASPDKTVKVDVVAVSMGGLVSRYAAVPRSGRRHLRINRLFTISSPHRGADLAILPTFAPIQVDMRSGSTFLQKLDQSKRTYQIFPYVRLGDVIVGSRNAAPQGEIPWWLPPEDVSPAHELAFTDDRIFLDIVLRLRKEPPIATSPRYPLPKAHGLGERSGPAFQ